jgi:hypothetical protein
MRQWPGRAAVAVATLTGGRIIRGAMEEPSQSESQRIITEFLEMVERLYFENYSLRQILEHSKLQDGSPAIPDWKSRLQQHLSNKLLADTIHQKKFAPLFAQIRQASQKEAIDEVLRSTERASSEDD